MSSLPFSFVAYCEEGRVGRLNSLDGIFVHFGTLR